MTNFARQVPRLLQEEHMATLAVVERLEGVLLGHAELGPEAAGDSEIAAVLRSVTEVAGTLASHFRFEEEQLFPRLAEAGDGDMGELLLEEHKILRPLADQLCEIASAGAGQLTPESWRQFRRQGLEFVERLISHIQKEEMGLLPALDDSLEHDEDQNLTLIYAQMPAPL